MYTLLEQTTILHRIPKRNRFSLRKEDLWPIHTERDGKFSLMFFFDCSLVILALCE